MAGQPAVISKGIRIDGELSGLGDLVVEGQVDGRVRVERHLTIAAGASVAASIDAARLTIHGRASGSIQVKERVELRAGAQVEADIHAAAVVLEDGATFNGTIQMDVGISPAALTA